MKSKAFKISIPTPCQENWENMTPNERGRHCANCNKTVIDFSLFTDKQLVEFFNKTMGNVCGRFNSYQLNRELVYTKPQNHFLYKLLFGTAMTLSLAGSAKGNYNPTTNPISEQNCMEKKNTDEENNKAIENGTGHINFVVRDSTKNPLPFATVVVIIDTTHYTGYTDFDGKSQIDIPDNTLGKSITVKVIYAGFKDITRTYLVKELPFSIELTMHSGPLIILGGPIWMPAPAVNPDNPDHYTIRRKDTPY